jgi:tetratricopeptide (TPR) repeat protein
MLEGLKAGVIEVARRRGLEIIPAPTLQSLQSQASEFQSQASELRSQVTGLQSRVSELEVEREQQRAELETMRHANALALFPSYAHPLKPTEFPALCARYDALSTADKWTAARDIMARVTADPPYVEVLLSPLSTSQFAGHYLFTIIEGSSHFAHGRLGAAADTFGKLAERDPTVLNILCFARTLLALGDDEKAIGVLQRALTVHPQDQYICMELATACYCIGRLDEANKVAQAVLPAFAGEHTAIEGLQKEIDEAIVTRALEKTVDQDVYTDDFVADTWWFYYRSYTTAHEFRDGNVELDSGIRREVVRLLKSELADASTFIDFGAFCGFTIAKLAEEFPGIRFIGIDRPEYAKKLNDLAFPLPNVEFVAGNILDLLDRTDLGSRPVLFHSRTAVFCYPAFLDLLYGKAKTRGVKDVVFQEGSTFFSRWHLKFYELGKYPAISMAGRGATFLHDYPTLLKRQGYSIQSSAAIRPRLLLDDSSGFGADHRIIHALIK